MYYEFHFLSKGMIRRSGSLHELSESSCSVGSLAGSLCIGSMVSG